MRSDSKEEPVRESRGRLRAEADLHDIWRRARSGNPVERHRNVVEIGASGIGPSPNRMWKTERFRCRHRRPDPSVESRRIGTDSSMRRDCVRRRAELVDESSRAPTFFPPGASEPPSPCSRECR